MPPVLEELHLNAFKSIRNAKIALSDLTLIVGRNGSGKSNILDALAVLYSLAGGGDLREALDGGRQGPTIRGGSEGCAPEGSSEFSLGCVVADNKERYQLDLTIRTSPELLVVAERLTQLSTTPRGKDHILLESLPPDDYSSDIKAAWRNGTKGKNPAVPMRATQLLTSQVSSRVPAATKAGLHVHHAADVVLEALSQTFILDPVPHQMREYVQERDFELRRNAENLSAVMARLIQDPETEASLLELVRSLSEVRIEAISSIRSELGDVMICLREFFNGAGQEMPARLMSDGTLRFLAIICAVWDHRGRLGRRSLTPAGVVPRLLVVEELENGLHPSQASLLIDAIGRSSSDLSVRTLATTHSPVILDYIDGNQHDFVMVVTREDDGWSTVTPLTEFKDYFEVVGQRSLGDVTIAGELKPGPRRPPKSLADIFGG